MRSFENFLTDVSRAVNSKGTAFVVVILVSNPERKKLIQNENKYVQLHTTHLINVAMTTYFDPLLRSSSGRTPKSRIVF
jgi:hypothetical protein